jgi:hypothetical protein
LDKKLSDIRSLFHQPLTMRFLHSLHAQRAPTTGSAQANGNVGELEKGGTGRRGHDDQAAQELIDPAVEKRVVRKIDCSVIPLVMALYLLAFLDRSNIGNARIAGMEEDLDLKGQRYDWLLTIFYISYITFQWQALLWKLVPPHIWCAFCVFGWGFVASVQAGINTWGAEMALRFLMGIFEAGFGPGIPYLLSFFYLRHEVGLRQGIFLSAAPLANTFAGALAYGITSGHGSLGNWRILFLVEGLPTLAMVPVAYFLLPDSPDKIRSLTPEEKAVAKARGVRQVGSSARVGSVNMHEVLATFTDPKAWFTAVCTFACCSFTDRWLTQNSSCTSRSTLASPRYQCSCQRFSEKVSRWSSNSLVHMNANDCRLVGFTAVRAQGLTAPPFFLSFLVTIGTTFVADRTQQRGLMIMILSAVGGVGYVMLATCSSVGARYAGVFLAAGG